ncbi:trypsin-like peptidase domain-containing protein [Corallococcus macrosporus]|uniref:Trypsin-like peptidase domain-containing protein n=1 Tax=Corallococcus macrosporus TaxID=35 RepID=A0ABS3DJ17_9BACT|nr:serine protease [Corallococcus macrosporus]MBN8231327.1 trypsin-like peptidase domain-containing protein [Corallococcus macrosporus]
MTNKTNVARWGASRSVALWMAVVSGLSAGACGSSEEAPDAVELRSRKDRAYDWTDDRTDVYAHPDPALVDLALHSTPIYGSATPASVAASPTLGAKYNLCPTERFLNDPTVGSCSGVLVDDDLILTAGHCFTGSIVGSKWSFGYYRPSATTVATVTSEDIFTVSEVVLMGGSTDPNDYAFVRLDRSATPRFTPARVAFGTYPLSFGAPVATIGSSSGMPLKIDSGGTVRSTGTSGSFYEVSLDIFRGNSGGAVYARDGNTVVAVVTGARGGEYVDGPTGTCKVAAQSTLVPTGVGTVIRPMLNALCATPGFTSNRLCFKFKGAIEGIDSAGWVTGWVFDRRTPEAPLTVTVNLTRTSFPMTGTTFTVQTDQLRPDINRQFGLTGNHGFRFQIPSSYFNGSGIVGVTVPDTSYPYTYNLPGGPMYY